MGPLARKFVKFSTKFHVATYRLFNGRFGQSMGGTVILVTTIGRKSKQKRTTPLMKVEHDGGYILAASFGGAAVHPAWFLNMRADPSVEVQDMSRTRKMKARIANDDERDALYQKMIDLDDRFAGYQKKSPRTIPVVVLTDVS